MADYAITGKKGSGKSLFAVGLIRDALRAGKRVATNLDVRPEVFGRPQCRGVITRLPDRPTIEDFEALGRGQDGVTEDENGIIVLDETSTFFNTRSWGDKARQPMLDWLVHSRKYGWDVYYICQGLAQIDKQLRETMIEYHIPVKRTDKWPIPIITPLSAMLGYRIGFPRLHVGIIKHGVSHDAITCGRKWYRGKDLYPAYDTQQVFLDRSHPLACGLHSVLSAYHNKGRYMTWWQRTKPALMGAASMGLAVGVAVGVIGYKLVLSHSEKKDDYATSDKEVIVGLISEASDVYAFLPDGSKRIVLDQKSANGLDYYLVEGKWHKAK